MSGDGAAAAAAPAVDLDDVQGLVLRGYRHMLCARHLLLRIDRRDGFRALLSELITENLESPYITTAADWEPKPLPGDHPPHCVNIGFTYSALRPLGLPDATRATFPIEFIEGAVARAQDVGDTGANAPEHWIAELRGDADLHVVLSLYGRDAAALEDVARDVRAQIVRHAAAHELRALDAHWPYERDGKAREGVVHFGYQDGLSQPTLAGVPPTVKAGIRDPLEDVPLGEFLLGHPTQRPGLVHHGPTPPELGHNGSFAGFRIAEQDVGAFDRYLDELSDGTEHGRELVAAQLCGRWRNGVPLVMSPDSDGPDIDRDQWNMFDFATRHPDPTGALCPVGSHVRRANPRRHPVAGGGGHKRRLIRRGMPYGTPHDRSAPDAEERGLVGMFICASLKEQFEFVMREWIDDGGFAGLGRTRDPLTGNNDPPGELPLGGDPPRRLTGLPRFVTTRGGAYLFLPSMTALRYLARLKT